MSAKKIIQDISPLLDSAKTDGSFLLAVCKLDELLKGNNPVSNSTVRRAIAFPKELVKLCDKFITEPKFDKIKLEKNDVSIEELTKILFQEISPEWLGAKIGDIAEIDKESFALALGNSLAFLQEIIPKIPASKKTKLSSLRSASFDRAYKVVSEPLSVLVDLNMGCLSRSQASTLRAVYPKVYEAMQNAFFSSASEALGKDSEFTLSWEKLKQLAVFNLNTSIPKDLQESLQANFEKAEADVDIQAGQTFNIAKNSQTNAQKIEGNSQQ